VNAPSAVRRAFDRLRLRGCDAVGPGATLDGGPWIRNRGRLVVGARLRLSSVPVQSHLSVAEGAILELGDDVRVGHGAAIAASLSVRIGRGTYLGPFVSIADTDFHLAGSRDAEPERTPIVIGEGTWIGSRVTVLRGSIVGDGAVVLSGSVVSGEVKPGARVCGVPLRPVEPAGVGSQHAADLAAAVPSVVAAALGLPAPPELQSATSDHPEWDSLGALRVLLTLEEAFGVTLDETRMARATHVRDVVDAVDAARRASAAPLERQRG
jgi:acetyltransferase-like isoleucine patch superfamily enzyme/acyl carrier protein